MQSVTSRFLSKTLEIRGVIEVVDLYAIFSDCP
jgi:hypothetical protein